MIEAKHHKVVYPFFKWLTRRLLKNNFNTIELHGDFSDNKRGILAIANHVSWWDGFWAEYLNQRKFHRKFHFMMLENQLKKHWYFRLTGGYSIKTNSKETAQSLSYTNRLLEDSNNFVLVFPQGKIHSAHENFIRFKKGIHQLVNNCSGETQILFIASFTDYLSNARPGLYIHTQIQTADELKNTNIEAAYNLFYTKALNTQKRLTS